LPLRETGRKGSTQAEVILRASASENAMKEIYRKQQDRSMRVVVFFSGGASSLQAMLKDPNRDGLYEIVAAFTNVDECGGIEIARHSNIPVLCRNFWSFCRDKGIDPRDLQQRSAYYEMVVSDLASYEPDLVCLSGFTGPGSIIVDPFLTEYENRILNVHPADLSILAPQDDLTGPRKLYVGGLLPEHVAALVAENALERRYKGEDAVYDAVVSGESYTRSSVHIASRDFDEGPLLVQSRQFPVRTEWVQRKIQQRNFRAIRRYADELQETMKVEGDGPAYLKTLELVSLGNVAVEGNTIFLNGDKLPYRGLGLD
jgi:folate-dependent phosphoribosylglycinamide formyltransferase PurN